VSKVFYQWTLCFIFLSSPASPHSQNKMGPLRGLCLAVVVGTAMGAQIISTDEAARTSFSDDIHESGVSESTDRDGKFLSVFQIVKFKNEACPATSGDVGVCFTAAECTAKGGVASGNCAESFGVCCTFKVNECGGTITQNNTYIESPGYPNAAPTGMCMFTVNKCDNGICQFRFEFEDVVLSQPDMGDCTNDTLSFSGFDAVSMKVVPSTLCGTLTGQHMYVTVKDQTDASKMVFNIASMASMARWRVKVVQLACTNTDALAPRGCLTYATEEAGTIESFNYNGGNGELINNQAFSHCIKEQDGFCDVALTSSNFDLGNGDSITFGGNSQTGTMFGSGGTLTWNFTGPYIATALSDDDNSGMNGGYSISYLLLPC